MTVLARRPRRPGRDWRGDDGMSGGRLGWAPYALLLPSLAFLALFFLFPMVGAFGLAFQDADGNWNLTSIQRMLGDSNFVNALRTTVLLVVLVLPIQLVLAMAMALVVNARLKGAGLWLY